MRKFLYFRYVSCVIVLLLLCLIILIINMQELYLMQSDHIASHDRSTESNSPDDKDDNIQQPIVWFYGKKLEVGYLKHVTEVFERIGFKTGDANSRWDVLWSHDYPFRILSSYLGELRPHQKVNHFPGSSALTNKVNLVSSNISFIPKAFRMPKQKELFHQYVEQNNEKLWVQKSNRHRGIRILPVNDVDLTLQDSFVQEFVNNPLLIDGRRFDIGLYVTITAIEPVRAYVYEGDWLVRFCSKDYYPFDPEDVEKYVITDDYTPLWMIPSLSKLYLEFDYTRKTALFYYLRKIGPTFHSRYKHMYQTFDIPAVIQGKNPEILNLNLQSAIRQIILLKESAISTSFAQYSSGNFFEMVRFDFILDNDMNVYLMEVNMSPNLSSGHYPKNKLLYEQVMFSMLNLVGIATVTKSKQFGSMEENEMQVSSKDIHVFIDNCTSSICNSCVVQVCQLCAVCISGQTESTFKAAYLEHVNRQTWRRVIPQPLQSQDHAALWNYESKKEFKQLTALNQIMYLWFLGKCHQDSAWCS